MSVLVTLKTDAFSLISVIIIPRLLCFTLTGLTSEVQEYETEVLIPSQIYSIQVIFPTFSVA